MEPLFVEYWRVLNIAVSMIYLPLAEDIYKYMRIVLYTSCFHIQVSFLVLLSIY